MPPELLAPDYVTVAGVEDYLSTGWTRRDRRIDGPALSGIPEGGLLATFPSLVAARHTLPGDSVGTPLNSFKLARSYDGGISWEPLPALDLCDGMPFTHDGKLYLLANNRGESYLDSAGEEVHGGPAASRNIVITRSDDGGDTWLEPVTLFEGSYWNVAAGMAVANGNMYRAFDVPSPDEGADPTAVRATGHDLVVAAADLSRDLLDPGSWRISRPVSFPGVPEALKRNLYARYDDNRWLEPNVVCVGGNLRVHSRVRIDRLATAGMCAVTDIHDDGENISLEFVQFYPMPGGQCKFHILHDDVSGLFWATANLVTNSQDLEWGRQLSAMGFHQTPGNERRFLMLMYSLDALNWFQAGCVAMSTNPIRSFHYTMPFIDADDMLIISRTSKNASNQHDSDLVTFHRITEFRDLALNLHPEIHA